MTMTTVPKPLRIYVAGPYSDESAGKVDDNVRRAVEYSAVLANSGHYVHCPHAATHAMSRRMEVLDCEPGYEYWMELDASIIERWAEVLFVISDSPGTQREIEMAERMGLPVYHRIDDVPAIKET